jgi:MPBQ/MSBQ methyltransferase
MNLRTERSLRIKAVNQWYDWRMFTPQLAGTGDFANYGYWDRHTWTYKEACENLMEHLLAFLPEKKGAILDVACGKGATTRYLLNYYSPKDVTGINVSVKQLERCKVNAPGCAFVLMDAAKMAFKDSSFDAIICMEAVFHFYTREKFLHDAHRVLKPGGRLVLSDILRTMPDEGAKLTFPAQNYVKDLTEYRTLYRGAGFKDIEVINATREVWLRFFSLYLWRLWLDFESGNIDWFTFQGRRRDFLERRRAIKHYLLVSAWKPRLEEDSPPQAFSQIGKG